MTVDLNSFAAPIRVAVIGAAGGIGGALADILREHERVAALYAFARGNASGDCLFIDLEDEGTIESAAEEIRRDGPLDLVFLATGILHHVDGLAPEKSFKALDANALERLYRINAIGPALVAKHFLPLLALDRRAVFAALAARVGSIGDNRLGGWHSYRMSKAALVMLIRNLAIETARKNPKAICVALHPGTVDTNLSKPFQGSVSDRKLFAPKKAADNLLRTIDGLEVGQSGHHIAWDGNRVPF